MATHAPGPKGEPVLGNARRFQADILQALQDGRRDYGDVVRFQGIGPLFPVHLVAHPDGVKHVLQDKHRMYPKTPFVSGRWRSLVGDGLVCSEGDFWRRQRRLAQPAFHRHLIAQFGEVMVSRTRQMLEGWHGLALAGAPVDLTSEMTRLALGVLGTALFAADWSHDSRVMERAVHVAIGEAYRKFEKFVSLPDRLPTPANRRFRAAKAELDEIIYRVIRSRQAEQGPHPQDLLESLMAATEDDGTGMTVEQVRNEVMTFMVGGHETVASGLTWTLFLLSRHPEVARQLTTEVDAVLGDREPTVDDLASMPYLECVVRESLRLFPPVPLISRTPCRDDEIDGYRIPAGSMVLLSAFVTHRHPDIWPNPEGFDPDRWAEGRADGRHRFSWWPFSGGPRKCIGDAFGLLEMQLVISMIVQRFRVRLVAGQAVLPRAGITLGQQEALMATLATRHPSAATTSSIPVHVARASMGGCPVMHGG